MAARKKPGGGKGRDAKAKGGRPTKHTKALAGIICERLAGGESLRTVCADEAMPDKATVLRWLGDDKTEFRDQYAHAREVQAEAIADEIVEIPTSTNS